MQSTTPKNHGWLTSGIISLAAVLLTIAMSVSAFAQQPGDLDTTFGNGGKLTDWSGSATDVAIQPDGKIVVVGGVNGWFGIARYNSDGLPDPTFGGGTGKVITHFDSWVVEAYASSVAIQHDGKILVSGTAYDSWYYRYPPLVRYNSDGTLDTSFDVDGVVFGSFAGGANHIAILPDGKILAGGGEGGFKLARYAPNGSPDTGFGTGGIVSTTLSDRPNFHDIAYSVAIQSDGKIVAVGSAGNSSNPDLVFGLVRYHSDGSLDFGFGNNGIVITQITSGWDSASAVGMQADGKIVVVGSTAVVRYTADGSLDDSFGSGGIVTHTPPVRYLEAIAVQPDGKIVAAGGTGSSINDPKDDFALVRYNPNGSPDTSFGDGDGISTVDFFNSSDHAHGMALDSRGRAVVVGQSGYSHGQFALARFLHAPGRALFDFDGDGRSDISVFRQSDSVWYVNQSTQGFLATQFGISTDKIAPSDYDGDGTTDIAVFRDGVWWLRKSSNGAVDAITFGQPSDIPVPGDYTGDSRDELAVYRNGQWWALDLANNQSSLINFGLATDKPVPADYDGDGKVDQAVYRNGEWHINRSTLGYTVVSFGLSTDSPVVGDYDGDRRADLAVYRDGTWYLQQSTAGFSAFQWGLSTDIPAPADYDGDGKTDPAVFRDGIWYQLNSTGGVLIQQFGLTDDKPIPSAYLQWEEL